MFTIGIDLGGTNIVAAVVDEKYNIIAKAKTPTAVPRSAELIFDDIAKVCKEAVEKAGLTMNDISSVGLGTPGTVNSDGVIEFANNLNFDNVPAKDMIIERLGDKPVYVANDANCAALGEAYAGCGNGAKNFIAVTLGTGVGSGVIIDGKIVTGVNNAGGECGHMVIVVDGEACTCGRHGCWETYASATGLIKTTKEHMKDAPKDSPIWTIVDGDESKVNGRTAFDAMRAGDPVGKAVVDEYIKYLSVGLTDMINIFQPAILCIGGGICNEGETLLAPVRAFIDREQYAMNSTKKTKVCKAQLGNDAGIIGAALLGKQED